MVRGPDFSCHLFTIGETAIAKISKRLPTIPAERTLKVIGGRWKASILYHLCDGPKRLSQLRRLAPAISQKVLVEQLREMEAHGVVRREALQQTPTRVDYIVTELGLSLRPVILTLCQWGKQHAEELEGFTDEDWATREPACKLQAADLNSDEDTQQAA